MKYSYNIYKIPLENLKNLKDDLDKNNLKITFQKNIKNAVYSFHFSVTPQKIPVRWIEQYKDFLPKINSIYNKLYSGIFLIEIPNQFCYAIPSGRSYNIVSKYADIDFGLNLAQRIVKNNSLKKKFTKHFFSNKDLSLITYRNDSEIDYDSGESFQLIKSSTISPNIWGRLVSFGINCQFNIKTSPIDIIDFLVIIENQLKKKILIDLPRAIKISNQKEISRLDTSLKNALNSEKNNVEVILSNNEITIYDYNTYHIYIKGKKKNSKTKIEFNFESLKDFANKNKIKIGDKLEYLNFIFSSDSQEEIVPLKNCIDFINKKGEFLQNGKWYKFNKSYFDFINSYVSKIKLVYEKKYDLQKKSIDEYIKENPKSYAEDYFNTMRENEGFINGDDDLIKIDKYKIEIFDLKKYNCLYFVKIGNPKKFAYVIDQAINTLQAIKNNRDIKLKLKIPKKNCLWLIFDNKKKINNLSELNSLIFHIKLIEWVQLSNSLKIEPIVRINYRI